MKCAGFQYVQLFLSLVSERLPNLTSCDLLPLYPSRFCADFADL
jgi:hypothetical protein